MKTREQKILEQVELQNKIQSAGFNIVNCGHCGSVLLHECNDGDDIDCPYCDRVMEKSDCPDFLYEGIELSAEFAQENEIKSVRHEN